MKTRNRRKRRSPSTPVWRRAGRFLMAAVLPVLPAACEWPDPEQARKNLHLPAPDFVADAARGEALYRARCIGCHGEAARGSRQGPPLVHKTYRPDHHPDIAFHLAVKDGVRQHHWRFGDMPPVEGVTPEEAGHITAYVRREQRRAGIR